MQYGLLDPRIGNRGLLSDYQGYNPAPMSEYEQLLQAGKAATVPGTGVVGMARNRMAAQERNPRPWLDRAAMATSPIPIVGDVLGLAADVAHLAANQEARTPINFGMGALGLLPFIPGLTVFHGSPHRINNVDPGNLSAVNLTPERWPVGDPFKRADTVAEELRKILPEGSEVRISHSQNRAGKSAYVKFRAPGKQEFQIRVSDHGIGPSRMDDPYLVGSIGDGRNVFGEAYNERDALNPALDRIREEYLGEALNAGAPYGRFDMSKIGTGEGAQAYGYGIYLAESRDVAEGYRTAGTFLRAADGSLPTKLTFDGKDIGKALDPETAEGFALMVAENQRHIPLDDVIKQLEEFGPDDSKYRQAGKWLRANRDRLKVEPATHLYTVDLPDEHISRMLDWDAPLSEQPEGVLAALEKMGLSDDFDALSKKAQAGTMTMDESLRLNALRNARHSVLGLVPNSAWIPKTGGELVEQLGKSPETSRFLAEHGIPGIRYWDGGSRAAGEGTRNFVIFDPDIVKILNRE